MDTGQTMSQLLKQLGGASIKAWCKLLSIMPCSLPLGLTPPVSLYTHTHSLSVPQSHHAQSYSICNHGSMWLSLALQFTTPSFHCCNVLQCHQGIFQQEYGGLRLASCVLSAHRSSQLWQKWKGHYCYGIHLWLGRKDSRKKMNVDWKHLRDYLIKLTFFIQ